MTQAYNLSQFANYLNTSGQVSASGLQSGVILASGTVSLFYQASAPTGWTQVTSLNDYALRIVSSAGGSTGGTTAFSTVFANQTVSVTVSGTTGATTLSSSQIGSHNHQQQAMGATCCGSYFQQPTYQLQGSALGTPGFGLYYNAQGNSGAPMVTVSSGGGGSHTHSFSGSGSGSVTLNVRYANIILCSKN